MAFCDFPHTYHKHVTNVSKHFLCHPTVGNLDISPNDPFRICFQTITMKGKDVEQTTNNVPVMVQIYKIIYNLSDQDRNVVKYTPYLGEKVIHCTICR